MIEHPRTQMLVFNSGQSEASKNQQDISIQRDSLCPMNSIAKQLAQQNIRKNTKGQDRKGNCAQG